MERIYTGKEYVQILYGIFQNNDTYYAWGGWGAYAGYSGNKNRYNVSNAPDDCFLFDCSGFAYKAIPWGWNGSRTKNGGASYKKEGFEALETKNILALCSDVSEDFSEIQIGELVYLPGHVGIYIGSGEVIECTSAWENGVMITACDNLGGSRVKYRRVWAKHGKLPFIKYEVEDNSSDDPGDNSSEDPEEVKKDMLCEIEYGINRLERAKEHFGEAMTCLTCAMDEIENAITAFNDLEKTIGNFFGGLKGVDK